MGTKTTQTKAAGEISVLLVDDHAMLRKGMVLLLGAESDIKVVGEAGNGHEAIAMAQALQPEVVVMDVTMPNLNGIEATREILSLVPQCRIIALSIHSSKRFVDDMLNAGAVGYLLKESAPEELIRAIHAVMRGEMDFSSAITTKVVAAYVEGMPNGSVDGEARQNADILQTKLHPPPPIPDLITRPQLIERLDEGRVRPLTLVSAPAGYGKSVLISDWLNGNDWPSAWISLDKDDSELKRFLKYFVAAIQSMFPHACEETLSAVSGSQLPSIMALSASLSNELEAIEQPFILVLDDYHHIDALSPVNNLLQEMLVRPPIPLHLVILTRHDPPLSRNTLRAQGQVTDVRMEDLRFSAAEARALLEKTAEVSASEDALVNVDHEMEGWAAGLRLLSMALRHAEDPDGFLQDLRGGVRQTREYLLQEVMTGQAPKLQQWMLKSAILNRFCPSLCEAVCGAGESSDSTSLDGVKFVDALQRANLFIVPIAGRGEWYRYHNLFQELLGEQLSRSSSAEEIAQLHARASAWFESEGLIEEAIKHALSIADEEAAADIFERNWRAMMNKGTWYLIARWLSLLPGQIVQTRPELMLARAWMGHYHFDYPGIPAILDAIEELTRGFESQQSQALLDDIELLRAYCVFFIGERAGSLEKIEGSLGRIAQVDSDARSQAELVFGLAAQREGQMERFVGMATDWLEESSPPGPLRETRLLFGLTCAYLQAGDPRRALTYALRLTEAARAHEVLAMVTWGYHCSGICHLQLGELDAAIKALEAAVEHRHFQYARSAIDSLGALMIAYQLRGQPEEAAAALNLLQEFADTLGTAYANVAASSVARLALMQWRGGSTEFSLKRSTGINDNMMFLWTEVPCITQCRVLLVQQTDAGLAEAEQRLKVFAEDNESHFNTFQLIVVLALQAMVIAKQKRSEEALGVLLRAVQLAEPGGVVFPFLEFGSPMADILKQLRKQESGGDHVQHILDAIPSVTPVVTEAEPGGLNDASLLEPLTNRELDILELLSQRLQNKEIAAQLFVSPETVKSHLKNLYQKLAVRNRREAAARAAEILPLRANSPGTRTKRKPGRGK